ncbi:sulfur carrier protein ThiS [uncultured Pseudodesulfovibrio sp.]|uniref:sulfur carrier protein ThiS n=1 Tax=uncultured Pseudodesulfovibrio sp. TaxID=2035858 RepID=UPI0029C632D4|nr:sulfur carrier protein ThiS [uncultured Pseudodesulfovibrio sp.]
MKVTVNGREADIAEGATILSMLEERGIKADSVVVERNRDIVPSEFFGDVQLQDGDHLEVLRFVGGG